MVNYVLLCIAYPEDYAIYSFPSSPHSHPPVRSFPFLISLLNRSSSSVQNESLREYEISSIEQEEEFLTRNEPVYPDLPPDLESWSQIMSESLKMSRKNKGQFHSPFIPPTAFVNNERDSFIFIPPHTHMSGIYLFLD